MGAHATLTMPAPCDSIVLALLLLTAPPLPLAAIAHALLHAPVLSTHRPASLVASSPTRRHAAAVWQVQSIVSFPGKPAPIGCSCTLMALATF